MATLVTSPLVPILNAIQAQVTNYLGLDPSLVFFVTRKSIPKFQGDVQILIEPGRVQPEPNMDQAAGRAFPLVYRIISITLRTRYGVDLSDRSDSWITDPQYGHYLFEELLVAALNNFQPVDANNNGLIQEVMHWIPSSEPVSASRDQTWGETTINFSVLYELSQSLTI
jgi:hypothetical protein